MKSPMNTSTDTEKSAAEKQASFSMMQPRGRNLPPLSISCKSYTNTLGNTIGLTSASQSNSHMNTLKWALYARKSNDSADRQIQSIPDQVEYFKKFSERTGTKILEVISDAKSAKQPDMRPGFSQLLKLIRDKKINALLCWKLDRLARNPVEGGTIMWMLQTGAIQCIQTSERCYYPTDNMILIAVELGAANQYVIDLSKNVRRGLQSKADKGWYPSSPPIGYLNSKYGRQGEECILKDPERFSIVRKMWDLMLSGTYSQIEILRIATDQWKLDTAKRKVRGRRPVTRSAVYKIFTDIFYTGNFMYAGKLYKGQHPAMITMEEFERVQRLLNKELVKPSSIEFAFTGVMRCHNCGSAITATKKTKRIVSTGELKTYTYYHCGRTKGTCKEPAVTENELEKQINELVQSFSIEEESYMLALEALYARTEQEQQKQDDILKKYEQHEADVQRKLGRLLPLLLDESISETEYKEQKTILEEELIKSKQKHQENTISSDTARIAKALYFSYSAIHTLKKGNYKEKKAVLLDLGSNQHLKEKNLYVSKYTWLYLIKNGELQMKEQKRRLELEAANNTNAQMEKSYFFPLWWDVIENVRTELLNSPPSTFVF